MPSPFPGMDPFLEHPEVFPTLHHQFITHLGEFLQARLPEPYYADLDLRSWVELSRRPISPDVRVLRRNKPARKKRGSDNGGGVAVATKARTKTVTIHAPARFILDDERAEAFIEIYAKTGKERLVTSIELLSPSNKTPGEKGRGLYLKKQREILKSKVHLVEIDLLRGGQHTTAVPYDALLEHIHSFDYHVCVHRFDTRDDYTVYAIEMEHKLPTIAIPLLPGDPDVNVDLQAVFDRSYDNGPYRRKIDYEEWEIEPPLAKEMLPWARKLVAAR